jgi:hypothetical protein
MSLSKSLLGNQAENEDQNRKGGSHRDKRGNSISTDKVGKAVYYRDLSGK